VVRDLGIEIWKWPTMSDDDLEAVDKVGRHERNRQIP
jgi:hypothetical protein